MEVSGQRHAPAALPQGNNPSAYWGGNCVSPRASLDVLEKRKISCLCRSSKPGPSIL